MACRSRINLHAALLAGAATQPCFSPVDPSDKGTKDSPPKPQAQTFAIGFSVTGALNVDPKVSLGAIFNVGASYEKKSSSGNTLTVTFAQIGDAIMEK